MGLDNHRSKADGVLDPLARAFRNVDPNRLTLVSMIFALSAGFFFFLGTLEGLLMAFLMVLLNSLFDALDGKVARLTGKASKKGDFLDHLVDRYADMVILAGIALSPWCRDWIGLVAIVGVFMTSYTGTQAQAMGLGRNYGGILGRADRMVMLMLFPLVQYLFSVHMTGSVMLLEMELTIIELMMVWFALAGNITALQRAFKAWKDIGGGA